jgi:Secretion system C-terminal sorting domain
LIGWLIQGVLNVSIITGATYQWYTCPSTLISGATSRTYTPTAIGDYKVEVTVSGCTVTSACVNVTTLGTSSFDISSTFKIYPNPAKNIVNIDFQDVENATVAVSDINGRVLFTQKLNSASNNVNIENLASGIYLFKVSSSIGSATSKVIKQ